MQVTMEKVLYDGPSAGREISLNIAKGTTDPGVDCFNQ